MRVLLVSHPACALHRAGRGHPERPARLEAANAGVRRSSLEVVELEAPAADQSSLSWVHSPAYVEHIRRFCESGGGSLDPDTAVVPESWEAALRAAGAGPATAEALTRGRGEVAFLAVRPPGHHALADRAMGFCLFNNVGLTADYLARRGGRVAIVDWDVHHGNGTQETFYRRDDVLYVSLHQLPAYPGTGRLSEAGSGDGRGATVNLPFPAGTGGDVYREAFSRVVIPRLDRFGADWLLVSAGYDAHLADPLAGLALLESDYGQMAAALSATVPPSRTIYLLEGGYDLEALEGSVAATLAGAAGRPPSDEPGRPLSPEASWRALELAADALMGRG